MAANKLEVLIYACRQERNVISTAKPMFWIQESNGLLRINFHQTGSGKFKMAAIKLEVLIYQLVDNIATRFK